MKLSFEQQEKLRKIIDLEPLTEQFKVSKHHYDNGMQFRAYLMYLTQYITTGNVYLFSRHHLKGSLSGKDRGIDFIINTRYYKKGIIIIKLEVLISATKEEKILDSMDYEYNLNEKTLKVTGANDLRVNLWEKNNRRAFTKFNSNFRLI